MSEGQKFDDKKNRLDLIPPQVIEAVGDILTHGAVKYAPYNWFKGLKYSRVYGALQRHLNAWYRGEANDSESGKPHLHHALCNLTFLITYEYYKTYFRQFDDRMFLTQLPPIEEVKPDYRAMGYCSPCAKAITEAKPGGTAKLCSVCITL